MLRSLLPREERWIDWAAVDELRRMPWSRTEVAVGDADIMRSSTRSYGATIGWECEQGDYETCASHYRILYGGVPDFLRRPSDLTNRIINDGGIRAFGGMAQGHKWLEFTRRMCEVAAYDGSGPWEFNSPAFTNASELVKWWKKWTQKYWAEKVRPEFPAWALPYYVWDWHAQYKRSEGDNGFGGGCGSHWHFRFDPTFFQENNISRRDFFEAEVMGIMWNTIYTIAPFMLPFFAGGTTFRQSSGHYAKPILQIRMGIDEVHRELTQNPEARDTGRFLTFNHPRRGRASKPITIELRVASTHPYVAATGFKVIQYILMKVFEVYKAGAVGGLASIMSSPKLTEVSTTDAITMIIKCVGEGTSTTQINGNIYETMAKKPPFGSSERRRPYTFMRPLPARLPHKLRWDTATALFEAIISQQLVWAHYDYKQWYTRVLWFLLNKGDIQTDVLDVYKGVPKVQTIWTVADDDFPGWRTVNNQECRSQRRMEASLKSLAARHGYEDEIVW